MQKKNLIMDAFFIYILWICLFAGFAAAAKESVPSLFVFGDSLVDAGNNNYLPLSLSKSNYPHNGIDFPAKKPTGRFSNGKIAADLLAEKFGLPLPPPYLSLEREGNNSAIFTGVSFASGAAGILNISGYVFGEVIPLWQQIQDYISVHKELVNQFQPFEAQKHLSKSIFMFVIGSVDFLVYTSLPELPNKCDPQQYINSMLTNFKEQLKRLYDYGARKLLVLGIGQIGCTPAQRGKHLNQECNDEANMLSTIYNKALQTMLEQVRQELHGYLSYSYFNSYKAMQDIYADPAAYGFTDIKSACCGCGNFNIDLPCFPKSSICPDRTQYFFWDRIGHLTEATYRVFVDQMFDGFSRYSFPLSLEQLISI